jgi:hypothetical protein
MMQEVGRHVEANRTEPITAAERSRVTVVRGVRPYERRGY